MGKFTYLEELALGQLQNFVQDGKFNIGLVIGQISEEENYVIHIAPVPKAESDETSSNKESLEPTSLSSVLEVDLTMHARQVSRMLPGGLDVIGIYCILNSVELNKSTNQEKIIKLLRAINSTTSKHFLGVAEPSPEMVLLFGCSESSKTGIKLLDMKDEDAVLVSSDMKSHFTCWIEIDYTYSLSQNFFLTKESTSQVLSNNVSTLLQPWATRVSESVILIDGQLRNDVELLHTTSEEKSPKKRGAAAKALLNFTPPKVMKAEFLEKTVKPTSGASVQEMSSSIQLSGTMAGRAFVNEKSTVKEAHIALRKDLLRSLMSRWEMHCDSLIEEPQAGPVIHEPPRRVFLEGGGLPVSLCDYLFPGDSPSDACLSAKELLDIVISEENVDVSLETYADPSEILADNASLSQNSSPIGLANNNNNTLIYLVSFAVFLFSLCAFYLLSSNKKDR